jgi:hypothetical protein
MYGLKSDVCGCSQKDYEFDIREESEGVYYHSVREEEVEIVDEKGEKRTVKQPVKKKTDHICRREFGAIAEEVYEICPEIVALDPHGDPLSVMYDRIALYLIPIVKSQRDTILAQATTIEAMQTAIADLQKSIERIDRERAEEKNH